MWWIDTSVQHRPIGGGDAGDDDQEPVDGALIDDLDPRSVAWIRGLIEWRDPAHLTVGTTTEEFLGHMGLMRRGKLLRAAILLLGRSTALLELKPTPMLDYRVITDTREAEMSAKRWNERMVCDQNIVLTYQQTILKLHTMYAPRFSLDPLSMERQATSSYLEVFREALVNLLTHQDYGDQGRSARLFLYADAISFENPGDSLLHDEDIEEGSMSDSRNPLIARALRLCGLAEQAGTGLGVMRRAWHKLEAGELRLENDRATKRHLLTLYMVEATPQATPQAWEHEISDKMSAFLQAFEGEMSRESLQEAMKIKNRKYFRRDYLMPAMEAGWIAMTRPDTPQSMHQRYTLTRQGRRALEITTNEEQ